MRHLIPARQTRPTSDVIFALNAEAQKKKAQGRDVVNATIGSLMLDDGRLAILPSVTALLHTISPDDWAAYAPIPGLPAFNDAVLDDAFQGHPTFRQAATAVATPGGTGALRHALMAYLEPGQAILTPSYFWGPYQTLCDEQERRLETFSMFDAAGAFDVESLDVALARQRASQGRVLVFLNDPCNNPTGYSLSSGEWQQVVDVLLRHGQHAPVTLLVDMAYYLYGAAQDPRAFLTHLAPLLGRVGLLFAWSGSKSFTHYGLRIGALLAVEPDEAQRAATQAALAYACRGTWSNCVRGGMVAIARLLTQAPLKATCDAEREGLKGLLRRRVEAFNAAARSRGLAYPRYEGGFFVTVFHPDAEAKARALREADVYVVPQKGALRVALCSVAEAQVGRLVEALAA